MPFQFICDNCDAIFERNQFVHHHDSKRVFCSAKCRIEGSRGVSLSGDPRAKLMRQIEVKENGCWEWTGKSKALWGYGLICILGRLEKAHRAMWKFENGPIPEGMQVLHKCDNPPCCRPDHLFLGTNDDNRKDMAAKQRSTIGIKNPMAKLTDERVVEIWRLAKRYTNRQIAYEMNVSEGAISMILHGKTWKHVSAPSTTELR